jgi:hypothetical protein
MTLLELVNSWFSAGFDGVGKAAGIASVCVEL